MGLRGGVRQAGVSERWEKGGGGGRGKLMRGGRKVEKMQCKRCQAGFPKFWYKFIHAFYMMNSNAVLVLRFN